MEQVRFMDFKNKVVWITGASSGIGETTAYEFAKKGANIILHYYTQEQKAFKMKQVLEEQYQRNVLLVQGDISKEDDVYQMIQKALNHFETIDILVNNAGIAYDDDFFEKEIDIVRRVTDVNMIGTYLMCKEVGKIFKKQGYGNIINITSTNGINTPYPESTDYDMSKAAIISLTHNVAHLLSPNCRVNAIAPGWVNTPMNENLNPSFKETEENKILLHRFADPQEIANVIIFLASDQASYINDTIIRVDGGIK